MEAPIYTDGVQSQDLCMGAVQAPCGTTSNSRAFSPDLLGPTQVQFPSLYVAGILTTNDPELCQRVGDRPRPINTCPIQAHPRFRTLFPRRKNIVREWGGRGADLEDAALGRLSSHWCGLYPDDVFASRMFMDR